MSSTHAGYRSFAFFNRRDSSRFSRCIHSASTSSPTSSDALTS
ncbi:hypothetical protein [Archangium lipolyticum]|nr:hypothetical protein [Archangium lipolyticum]